MPNSAEPNDPLPSIRLMSLTPSSGAVEITLKDGRVVQGNVGPMRGPSSLIKTTYDFETDLLELLLDDGLVLHAEVGHRQRRVDKPVIYRSKSAGNGLA